MAMSLCMVAGARADNTPAGDVTGDSLVTLADLTALVNYLQGMDTTEEGHSYVDLGLASGTLWATCNVGATTAEGFGDYFAWGETEEKSTYYWSTYQDSQNGSAISFQTYYSGGQTSCIATDDDAARHHWGSHWQQPTLAQLRELKESCTWQTDTLNGMAGMTITGPNGNHIFMPKAGRKYGTSVMGAGIHFYYWSGELYCTYDADANSSLGGYMDASFYNTFEYYGYSRNTGFPVRPVVASPTLHLRCDVNGDGTVNRADLTTLVHLLVNQ